MKRINAKTGIEGGSAATAAGISDPTREKLLDAAGRIFVERGYQRATIREDLRRGGRECCAAVPPIIFGDKLGLYTEVCSSRCMPAGIDAIPERVGTNGGRRRRFLRAVIRARLRSICRGDRPDWHFRILRA